MAGSRRPGLLGTDPLAPSPRTPGLLGANDAGQPSWRHLPRVVGDTPGLVGANDWADPRLGFAAVPAAFVPQTAEESFTKVAADKMWDLFKDHPNQAGSNRKRWLLRRGLPDDTEGRQRTDCITYVRAVLVAAYEHLGQRANAAGVKRALAPNGLGTDLADYLVRRLGWKAHYWNPDVNHPRDFDYPKHNYSYWNTLKHGVYYAGNYRTSVPVRGFIVNYRPVADYANPAYEDKARGKKHNYPTAPETAAYERFKQVKFAFGLAHGGDHTFLYSDAHIFEVHWNALGDDDYKEHVDADGDDLYERSPFDAFGWHSGLMVVPPDAKFESDQKTAPPPQQPDARRRA